MAGQGVELATAWVRLTFSAEGSQRAITDEINKADVDGAGDAAGKKYGSKFGAAAKVGIAAAGALAVAGLAKIFSTGMEEIKFGEQISAQTDQLIKNTGAAFTTSWVEDYTLALSKVSGISEEDLQSAGNAVLKFGDVSEDTYKRSVDAINNMGAAGKDVQGVGEALGKALADPAAAAGLLKRQGVILNDEQQKLIENFVAVGDKAGAQAVILDSLEGTYGGMAEATGGTMTGNLNKLGNMFENLSATAVSALLPAITSITAGLTGVFTFLSENESLLPVIAVAIGALALAFVALSVAMWAASLTPIGIIIGLIIIAVIALIAAIVFLVMNWDQVVAFITTIWSGFISWITGVIDGFVGWWNGIWTAVWEWIVSVWEGIVSAVTTYFRLLYIGLALIGLQIFAWWNGMWSDIAAFIAGVWNSIVSTVQGLWAGLQGFLMGAISGFFGWWNGIWSTIGNVIRTVFGGVASFLSGVWNGIVGTIRGAINSIIGSINSVIGAINGVIGAVGSVAGLSLSVPTIPGLATGGTITRPGTVLVGERGPELLNLPRGASVNPQIPDLSGPSRPTNVQVFIGDEEVTGRVRVVVKDEMSQVARSARLGGGR